MPNTLSQTLPPWFEQTPPLSNVELITNSQASAVNKVLDWLQQIRPDFIPSRCWLECQTALIEGFDNVIEHAHRHLPPSTAIVLRLNIYSEGIEIEIWDYGEPFDLLSHLERVPEKQNQSAEHGRGFILIRRIVDYITYTRTDDGRNHLQMLKSF